MGGMDIRQIDEDWVIQNANRLWNWLGEQDKRDRDAEQRHRDLMRVHQEGWKGVAGAIERGLGSIADAIRDNRR